MRMVIAITTVLGLATAIHAQSGTAEKKWEKAIRAFETQDQKSPPPQNSVLFLGSSSIRMWKLDTWFPNQKYLNRGFGGSEISDSIEYFDRVVKTYKPATIVFYAGDNDIAKGKSPERVLTDFKTFADMVKKALPKSKIIFVAIKPSLSRWKLVSKMRDANARIKAYIETQPNLFFADIDTPMIGKDGTPQKHLFVDDGLHLSTAGYQVWYDVIHPLLTKTNPAKTR